MLGPVPASGVDASQFEPRGAARLGSGALPGVTEPGEQEVDQFIIFGGYGEVMYRFQTLEMGLWGLQTKSIKPHTHPDQAMAKVEKWNGTTFGEFMRGMKNQPHWPKDLLDKLLHAVDVRNYLAHHFLREHFVAERTEANRESAAQQLANLAHRLDELSDELDAHLLAQGIASIDDLDEETAAEVDAMRPKDWFYFMGNEPPDEQQQP